MKNIIFAIFFHKLRFKATAFFALLSIFIAPATAVVGLKSLYNVAKD